MSWDGFLQLLHHVRTVFEVPISQVFAWTDSTIVLSWLSGNPRRFKTFVGNRVSSIIDSVPPPRWNHVIGAENPADCASRGVSPCELLNHPLWWEGPSWLHLASSHWPKQTPLSETTVSTDEEREVCLLTTATTLSEPIISTSRYSSFIHLCRVNAWIQRFVANCRASKIKHANSCLTTTELAKAERYWLVYSQYCSFPTEITALKLDRSLPKHSNFITLRPFLDNNCVLRVGGRETKSAMTYSRMHPVILHGNQPVTKLIIRSEHLRLLHAGPTLLSASLGRRFHIITVQKIVRTLTRQCTKCQRQAAKPVPQMMGQLPSERITPGFVFQRVGVDYVGPFLIKSGSIRKPTILKAYACVFVSLTVKAVHVELVSSLTTGAFIATLRRFIGRRGLPTVIWSDYGTNFVGAKRELIDLYKFLAQEYHQEMITDFCTSQSIEWRFIPEHGPHFGGLWEAAIKSVKKHLRSAIGESKLSFEELTTVLVQVEACLNSRPLVPVTTLDDDGIEVLTPGHFLIFKPPTALPDPSVSHQPISLIRRWHLCQNIVKRFWQRWASEYLPILNRYNKWRHPTRNISIGDIMLIKEDAVIPTKWPLGRVVQIHPGNDKLVRVATVKTAKGTYKRPVSKLAILIPRDHDSFEA